MKQAASHSWHRTREARYRRLLVAQAWFGCDLKPNRCWSRPGALRRRTPRNELPPKPFTDGRVGIAEGERLYGVPYQVAGFVVVGYQPLLANDPRVAGQVSSRMIVITKELRDTLRILATTSGTCIPPAGTTVEFGAVVAVDFSEAVEFVDTNLNSVVVRPVGHPTRKRLLAELVSAFRSSNASLSRSGGCLSAERGRRRRSR